MTMLVSLLMTIGAATSQPAASPPPVEQDMVVTGFRPERHPLGRAEVPYSETARVPAGSRIARRVPDRPFRSIASESGVAGMLQGSGMDGTGGSSHNVARRRVTECVVGDRQVREDVACILFNVHRNTGLGELRAAREALEPLLRRDRLNAAEHFYIGHHAYALAEAEQDETLRLRAIRLLLASGRLSELDRARAERTLATLTRTAH